MQQLKRPVRIALIAALIAVLASWTRSYFFMESLEYRWGRESSSTAGPDDPRAIFDYHSRTLRLSHCRGILHISLGNYTSFANTPEQLEVWRGRRGWSIDSVDLTIITVVGTPEMHFRSATSFYILGLGTGTDGRQGETWRWFSIPHWLLAILALAPPALGLLRHQRRASRTRRGRCPGCAYDLKGNTMQCPECGRRGDSPKR